MLVLDQTMRPVDRVDALRLYEVRSQRMTTMVRIWGKLVAYVPERCRSYYQWALVIAYRRGQHVSVHQMIPPHLRIVLFSRWELGVVLGNWLLGLRLGQPLAWLRPLHKPA